jgi:hypothetical protein
MEFDSSLWRQFGPPAPRDLDHSLRSIASHDRNPSTSQEQRILTRAAIQFQDSIARAKNAPQHTPNHIPLGTPDHRFRKHGVVRCRHAVERHGNRTSPGHLERRAPRHAPAASTDEYKPALAF